MSDAAVNPASTVLGQVLGRLAADLMRLADEVPQRFEADAVHQLRVTLRRTRSLLKTFEPLFDPSWATMQRAELGWLAGCLGEVRELDVLLEMLRARVPQHETVIQALEQRRALAQDAAARTFRSDRFRAISLGFASLARPPFQSVAEGPAEVVLVRLVRKRWRRLRDEVHKMPKHVGPSEMHRVRILAKRARYAADVLGPVSGAEAVEFAAAAAALQDLLGLRNDAFVARRWLLDAARQHDGACAFAAGELACQLAFEGESIADDWRRAYRRVEKRARWLRR